LETLFSIVDFDNLNVFISYTFTSEYNGKQIEKKIKETFNYFCTNKKRAKGPLNIRKKMILDGL